MKTLTITPGWNPARNIVTLREPGDVPRIGDVYGRTEFPDGRVLWQRQTVGKEFHCITDPREIAEMEALFQQSK